MSDLTDARVGDKIYDSSNEVEGIVVALDYDNPINEGESYSVVIRITSTMVEHDMGRIVSWSPYSFAEVIN